MSQTDNQTMSRQNLKPNRSGVMPYRLCDGKLEVLLITAMSNGRWIIPKGNFESDMTSWDSAAKEGYEEAGVIGNVDSRRMGVYDFTMNKHYIVEVFAFEVTEVLEQYPEVNYRQRHWFEYREAANQVREQGLRDLILSLPKMIS